MPKQEVKIEYYSKKIVPVYGGSKIIVDYEMTVKDHQNGTVYVNTYVVICIIGGIEAADPTLRVESLSIMNKDQSNECTLTIEAATELFEDQLS